MIKRTSWTRKSTFESNFCARYFYRDLTLLWFQKVSQIFWNIQIIKNFQFGIFFHTPCISVQRNKYCASQVLYHIIIHVDPMPEDEKLPKWWKDNH